MDKRKANYSRDKNDLKGLLLSTRLAGFGVRQRTRGNGKFGGGTAGSLNANIKMSIFVWLQNESRHGSRSNIDFVFLLRKEKEDASGGS
jgi:hypothetical protein